MISRPENHEELPVETVADASTETLSLGLHAEELTVERRLTEAIVRIASVTREREQLIDEPLTRERVEVERMAVGRTIDAAPPVREEGDTTIIPVVEEVVVVERRLVLKEEIHVRRVRLTERHREIVMVREQDAVVTRISAETQTLDSPAVGSDRQTPGTDPTQTAQEQH